MIHLGRFLAPIAAKIAPKLLFFSLEEIWLVWYGMSDAINDELSSSLQGTRVAAGGGGGKRRSRGGRRRGIGSGRKSPKERLLRGISSLSSLSSLSSVSSLGAVAAAVVVFLHAAHRLNIRSVRVASVRDPTRFPQWFADCSTILFQSPKDALELSYFASEKTRLKKRVHFWN